MNRIRDWAANAALLAASVLFTVCILDLVVAPRMLTLVPLKLQPEFREPAIRTLTQSSKRGAVPDGDWIAIVGDSYAAGEGDWFRSVDQDRNPPFHSAHLIRDATGRDVVSFGHSGAGSLRALVSEPLGQLAYLEKTWLYAPRPPADLLIYFYPGNDLTDNVADLERRFDGAHEASELEDPAAFRRFLADEVLAPSKAWRQAEGFRLRENFFVTRNLRYALARRADAWLGGSGAALDVAVEGEGAAPAPGPVSGDPERERERRRNRVRAAGRTVKLGRPLRAPGVVLDDREVAAALQVFRHAARFLAERLPETRIHVIHLPSPAAVYEHEGDAVWVFATYFRERDGFYPVSRVVERSDAVCEEIAAFAREEGFGFVDVRPIARAASADAVLHGPIDWRHLNRQGQEMLAGAVTAMLAGRAPPGCGRLAAATAD